MFRPSLLCSWCVCRAQALAESASDSCLLPELSHRQITGIPSPAALNAPLPLPLPRPYRSLTSRSARSRFACAHVPVLTSRLLWKPEVTTPACLFTGFLSLSLSRSPSAPLPSLFSPSLTLPHHFLSPLFLHLFIYFLGRRLCR